MTWSLSLIRMVLGLDDVSTRKAEVQGVKKKSVKRDALPLPDSPNDSEAASRLTRALESTQVRDAEGQCRIIVMDLQGEIK